MLTELCQELRNWFVKDKRRDIITGTFTIQKGKISPTINIKENQYFRIIGSLYNDGVHQFNGDDVLLDEEFEGGIWLMHIPPEVIALSREIDSWNKKYAETLDSPFTSESFGGTYSYSKRSSSTGDTITWQDNFKSKLRRWAKL